MNLFSKSFLILPLLILSCRSSDVVKTPAPESYSRQVAEVTAAPMSKIEHLIVIIQENHSFDNYFGSYCKAPAGSNPKCTAGAACCEASPKVDPQTKKLPTVLTDAENGAFNPNHESVCETKEINGGAMDRFTTPIDSSCGNPRNFAVADRNLMKIYHTLANKYALADRYFQPIVGASSSNDMYLARAGFVFQDNDHIPDAYGSVCGGESQTKIKSFTENTIGHLLMDAKVNWSVYAAGYQVMVDAEKNKCVKAENLLCPAKAPGWPCYYDSSDNPFAYYQPFKNNDQYIKDFNRFAVDLKNSALPAVSFIKAIGYDSEHPGYGITISKGQIFVQGIVDQIQKSKYAQSTLILMVMDEGGGYYDHVKPPPTSQIDGKDYGPRVPLIAIGPFAKTNYVSHVTMEHSSIVKFIEWNWLGGKTGQLGQRDTEVNNIGSLLDPKKTGIVVPVK